MGRGKIEIKRIENTSNRQVTHSKRTKGIIKKAQEITVLCDAKVSLVIFATSGKMHEYCSSSTTWEDMLDKYQKKTGRRLWDAKHESLSNEIERVKKENDNMQIELRYLKGEDLTSLKCNQLMNLEETLEKGLADISDRKMEYYNMMKRHNMKLENDNKDLHLLLQRQGMGMEEVNYVGEMEKPYNQQRMNTQLPFGFRVQPMQPNLQERI